MKNLKELCQFVYELRTVRIFEKHLSIINTGVKTRGGFFICNSYKY